MQLKQLLTLILISVSLFALRPSEAVSAIFPQSFGLRLSGIDFVPQGYRTYLPIPQQELSSQNFTGRLIYFHPELGKTQLDLVYELTGGDFVGRFRQLPKQYAKAYNIQFFYARIGRRIPWGLDMVSVEPKLLIPLRISDDPDLELVIQNWAPESFLPPEDFIQSLSSEEKRDLQVAHLETYRLEKVIEEHTSEDFSRSGQPDQLIVTTKTWLIGSEMLIERKPLTPPFVSALDEKRILLGEARVIHYQTLNESNAVYLRHEGVRAITPTHGLGINYRRMGFSFKAMIKMRCDAALAALRKAVQ